MAIIATDSRTTPSQARTTYAVVGAWLVLCLVLTWYWSIGHSIYGDFDDTLKLALLRHILSTGDLADRTLPSILQPELFTTHWTWIADAPYLLATWALRPFVGDVVALQFATFALPLILLLVLLVIMARISIRLGYQSSAVMLLIAATIPSSEFQPGRIDYHNVQMLLLMGIVCCAMTSSTRHAAAAGVLAALSFAISFELAFFIALTMAIYVARFIVNKADSEAELLSFGTALLVALLVLWAAVNPYSLWDAKACDQYSTPHLTALGGAAITFIVSVYMVGSSNLYLRVGAVCAGALATTTIFLRYFPDCVGGPYGAMDPYVYQNLIGGILQEMSVLSRPEGDALYWIMDVVLAVSPALIVGGAFLGGAFKGRSWVVFALFAGLTALVGLSYIRYLRFVGLFNWAGLLLFIACIAQILPSGGKLALMSHHVRRLKLQWLLAPSVALAAMLPLVVGKPFSAELTGDQVAGFCSKEHSPPLSWPSDARIMAATPLTVELFKDPHVTLISIPVHRAEAGLNRTYRFFDNATQNPKQWFDTSEATNLVICSGAGKLPDAVAREFPVVNALMKGSPPQWLSECTPGKFGPYRIYRRTEAPQSACPTLASQAPRAAL